jgi:quercetin dioxygenase-like cupin family protein
MCNILKDVPYNDEGMGKRKVVGTRELLIIQIALKPGQSVPQHAANSNVHLLVIKGDISVDLSGEITYAREGDVVPVEYKKIMKIANEGERDTTFLVLKTPNPSEMNKG